MATKTQKSRKAKGLTMPSAVLGEGMTHYQASDEHVVIIKIAEIRSNSTNPRESAPALTQMGYGIFNKVEGSDKPDLISLGLSEKAEDRAEYVALVKQFEDGIVQLAHNLRIIGMLQPIQVRAVGEGYDLIFGCRRLLAALYNFCDDPAHFPAEIKSLVCVAEDERSRVMALSENLHRLNMNPMEQARIFLRLKRSDYTVQQIADQTNIDHQVVRQRLKLLQLPPEMQSKVEEGELGVVKALTLIKGKGDPKKPGQLGKGHSGDGTRRSVPSVKDFSVMYEVRDCDEVYTEQVRRFIAAEIIKVDYMTHKQLLKEKEKAAAAQSEASKNKAAE